MTVQLSPALPGVSRRRFVLSVCLSGAAASLLAACGGAAGVSTTAGTAAASVQPATTAATTVASSAAAAAATSSSAATAAVSSASAQPAAGQAVSISLSYRSGNTDYFQERGKAFLQVSPDITIVQQPIAGSNNEYYPKRDVAGDVRGDENMAACAGRGGWEVGPI